MTNPQPLGGNDMPRFAGGGTFMRLPGTSTLAELDVAVVGVPFDIGTSNRPGARYGPRDIRAESVLLRPYNMATRAAPFDSLRIDDTGDVATNASTLDGFDRAHRGPLRLPARARHRDGQRWVATTRSHSRSFGRSPRNTVRSGWSTSMPIPISTTRCSARRSPTARRFAGRSRRACSTEPGRQIGVRGTGYAADDFDWSPRAGLSGRAGGGVLVQVARALMDEVRETGRRADRCT